MSKKVGLLPIVVAVGAVLVAPCAACSWPSSSPTGTRMTLRLLPERLHLFDSAGLACQRTVELPA